MEVRHNHIRKPSPKLRPVRIRRQVLLVDSAETSDEQDSFPYLLPRKLDQLDRSQSLQLDAF